MIRTALICYALCALAPAAWAVQKCVKPDGSVEFTDAECKAGTSATRLDVRPNTVDGAREQALRDENQRLREQLRRARSQQDQPPAAVYAAPAAPQVNPQLCRSAQWEYEVATSSRSSDPRAIEAKRSAMQAACGLPQDRTIVIERQQRPTYYYRPAIRP